MNEELTNIELSPDNVIGYLITTKGYMEEDDDRRKRPIFYWKAFHLYPIILTNEEEFDIEDIDYEDVDLTICTEGGDMESYNFISMSSTDLKSFIRTNPQFRLMSAEQIFTELNIIQRGLNNEELD